MRRELKKRNDSTRKEREMLTEKREVTVRNGIRENKSKRREGKEWNKRKQKQEKRGLSPIRRSKGTKILQMPPETKAKAAAPLPWDRRLCGGPAMIEKQLWRMTFWNDYMKNS